MLRHPGYARVHLVFFKELPAPNLIDTQLDLLIEPVLFRDEAVNGLNYEIVGAAACSRGKTDKRLILAFGKVQIHLPSV